MSDSRRFFLKSFSLGAAALATADGLIAKAGGDLNVKPVRDAEIDAARARLKNHFAIEPAISSYVEVRDHALYDVLRVPAGLQVPKYFPFVSAPVGYNQPGTWSFKTFADTNVVRANQLPPPCEMYVERILFLLSDRMHPDDRDQLAMSYWWEFMLADKVVARAPLARCPVTGDLASIIDFKREGEFNNPVARRRADVVIDSPYCMHLTRPIHIACMQQFAFNLYGREFATRGDVEMFALLDGVGVFGIQ
jgi:hypothetical protein